jgi:Zn-dependent protease with chaperone function
VTDRPAQGARASSGGGPMRTTLRALLALGLLAGFYLLVFSVVAIDLGLLAGLAASPTSAGVTRVLGVPGNAFEPAIFSVPLLIAVFYGVFRVSGRATLIAWSVPVTPDQAPGLWAAVETLAGQVGTPAPTEIRLISDANAMVAEESYLLGLVPGRRRLLYVGAPLLAGMTADELRAVLCHELGHYARKHTRLAALVYRGTASLRATLGQLRQQRAVRSRPRFQADYTWLLLIPLSLYARLYYRLSRAVSRRQELEADAAAAAIAGPAVTADALRAVHAIGVCWEVFRTEVVAPMRRSGRMPDDAFSAFGAMLADPLFEPKLAGLRESMPEHPPSRLDTHPSFATRLDLLSKMPAVPIARSSGPADGLLADRARLFERVGRALSPDGAELLPWRQWLDLVAQTRATGPAQLLRRAVARLPGARDRRPLAAVLNLLETGQARQIAAELVGLVESPVPPKAAQAPPPADGTDPAAVHRGEALLLSGMFSLVGHALVAIRAATWQLSLDGECSLVARDITSEELTELLAAAVSRPSDVSRLRLHLAALGVDVRTPLELGDTQAPSATARATAQATARATAQAATPKRRPYPVQTVAVAVIVIVILGIIGIASRSPTALPGATPQDPYVYTPPAYQTQPPITLPTEPVPVPGASPTPNGRLIPVIPIPTGYSSIVVRPGDTLTSIASGCGSTVAALQVLNHLGSSTAIYAGERLKVFTLSLGLGTCH